MGKFGEKGWKNWEKIEEKITGKKCEKIKKKMVKMKEKNREKLTAKN